MIVGWVSEFVFGDFGAGQDRAAGVLGFSTLFPVVLWGWWLGFRSWLVG